MSLRSAQESSLNSPRGYTLVETLIVAGLISVVAAIAAPMMGNALAYLRLSGDARNTSNAIALSKMRAASVFGRVRLYIDVSGGSFHLEAFDHTSTICCWNSDAGGGGSTYLSQGVTFNFGVVSVPPPNNQVAIGQPPLCKSNTGQDIANTACVIFNLRGIPVDASGAPGVVTAVYLTDGTAVYSLALSATGMVRTWKTKPLATPAWLLQ
jgi:prepilin-type N-terminal cleavage/methylation domain-containing protein